MSTYSRVRPRGAANGTPCHPSLTCGPLTPRPSRNRPLRQGVEGRGGHRRHRGRARRDLHDRGPEVDPLGQRPDPGEHRGHVRAVRLRSPRHGIPEAVGLLRDGDVVLVHAHAEVAEVHSEFHGSEASGGCATGARRRPTTVRNHAPATNGDLRSLGLPPCPRHDDLGPHAPTRRAPASSCARSSTPGGTLVDTAHGYSDGASEEIIGRLIDDDVPREDLVICTKSGISRRSGQPGRRHLAAQPAEPARHLARTTRHRPRRPVAGPHLVRRGPADRDAVGARVGRQHRPGALRRGLELQRLAGRAGDVAARAGAGPVGGQRGRVLPDQPHAPSRTCSPPPRPSGSGCSPGPRWGVGC